MSGMPCPQCDTAMQTSIDGLCIVCLLRIGTSLTMIQPDVDRGVRVGRKPDGPARQMDR